MQGLHGVTAETPERLVFDVGVLYRGIDLDALRDPSSSNPVEDALSGATVLGATRGGATFDIEREVREIEVDGARGPIKGLRRVVAERGILTATLVEIYDETLKLALGGTSVVDHGNGVKEFTFGDITDDAYFDNLALVAKKKDEGNFFIVGVTEAINDEGVSFSFEDQNELGFQIRAVGHFDPGQMDKRPFFMFDVGKPVTP